MTDCSEKVIQDNNVKDNAVRETGEENLEKVVIDPIGVTQQYLDNVNLKKNVHVIRLDPIESSTATYNVGDDLSNSVFRTGVKDLEDLFYTDELLFNISDQNPTLKNKFLKLSNWTYTNKFVQDCNTVTDVNTPFHLIESLKTIYNQYNNGWDNISVRDKLNLTKTLSQIRYITDFRNLCGEELVGLNLGEFKNVAFVQACNLYNITGQENDPNDGKDPSLNRAPIGLFAAPLVNSLNTGTMALPKFPVHTSATALLMAEIRSPNMSLPNVEIHFPLKFDTSVVKYNINKTYTNSIENQKLLQNINVEELPKVDSPVVIVNNYDEANDLVNGDYVIKSTDVFGKITGFTSSNRNPEISVLDTRSLQVSVYSVSIEVSNEVLFSQNGDNEKVNTSTQIQPGVNVMMFYCVETTPPEMTNGKLIIGSQGALWKQLQIGTA
jgi:hypothetical protein